MRARLTNGVIQYKRKWGGEVSFSNKIHKQFWIKIRRNTPAVRQFFQDTPLIIIDGRGQLQGLITTDDPTTVTNEMRQNWDIQYATPGLGGLLVRSLDDLL